MRSDLRAGSLFANAAFAATQLGRNEAALALASEGRARLLAVTLSLRTLNLTSDKRHRADELRTALRAADRMVEDTQAVDRAEALDELASVRQELLKLVREADAGEKRHETGLAQAAGLVARGGAVVVPIITAVGGKIMLVTKSAGERASVATPSLTIVDLPDLTTDRIDALVRGDRAKGVDGWVHAYAINYQREGPELERRWPQWLRAIGGLGPELWQLIGSRLDVALRARGVRTGERVVWLPSGALGILPLGLAEDPTGNRRLGDLYEIVYVPSLETLASAQRQLAKHPPATLAAVINPTADLSGTEKEGALVASYFARNARVLLEREAAKPKAVLSALKGKTYWHFASHGTFSWSDARQSALVMHGRTYLTVGRLLESDNLGSPRLVVLSACETGLYDINRNPNEFTGLPSAFMALGAADVLGTLWPVSDTASALLISRFYDLHMRRGLSPPTALRRAQQWLRRATNVELAIYAKVAAARGRLQRSQVAEIERELSREGLARSRNLIAIEWLAHGRPWVGHRDSSAKSDHWLARPYAHPYFWAGFIYSGL